MVYKRYVTLSPFATSVLSHKKMSLKPLHVKKIDKDVVLGVYVQAPKKKTGNPVPVIKEITEFGEPVYASTASVHGTRDDRMADNFRRLKYVGLKAGMREAPELGTEIPVVRANEGDPGFKDALREQLARAAELRVIAPPPVEVAVLPDAAPLLVQVAVLPDAAPPPVEVAVLPDAELHLVDVAVVPEVAPPPIDVDAQLNGTSRYPKRIRTQKCLDETSDARDTKPLHISKEARHAFKATIKKFGK
jgi:hypothetical protein